ncbi:MAG: DUF3048 domain-containing protein [Bifidobacteriaceae bacterium]|jgi:hypothetical protein|nr:DUF3048 domain-containing protein [Bifidobacteriaceae bacterium]
MRSRAARRFAAVAALAALVAAGGPAGCAKPEARPVATKTTYQSEIKEPPPSPPPTWPLTGELGEVAERAALAVKVENSSPARPQTGLEQADVVWEEMIEGGESRFIAVYNSIVPESVGPVRSVRPMDGPILGAVRGLLACSGGQDRFIAKAKDAGLQVFQEDAKGYYRSDERRMPYNLYLRPAEIWAQADDSHKALPQPEFAFAALDVASTAALAGTPAAKLSVAISPVAQPTWTWEAESRLFLRSERDTPSTSSSGMRLSASNVIALAVAVQMAGGTDVAGSPIPETVVVGSGQGIVASAGHAVDVVWTKESVASPFVLQTPDGAPVRLAQGQTWIELVPISGGSWSVAEAAAQD